MKPTLHDIARQTGFSVATISRALHRSDSPNVSAETRRRVSEAAQRVGYRPNLAGRILSTGRSHTISYWTFDAFTPYYSMVARCISREAMNRGYSVVMNSSYDPARILAAEAAAPVSPALHNGFDGLIACDVAYPHNDYAAQLRELHVPLVGIGLNYPLDTDYVGLDLYVGGTEATQHLVEAGCRRIALMCDDNSLQGNDPRISAYHDVLAAAGLEPEIIKIRSHARAYAREVAATLAAEQKLPNAIFCLNDEVAVGCYRGLCDAGVRVPGDILLVGCDGTEEAAYQSCPITSIVPPVADVCKLAWDYLEARIANPDAPLRQTILAPTLAIRESSGGNALKPGNQTAGDAA